MDAFYAKCDCRTGCHLCDGTSWVSLSKVQARVHCTCGYNSLDCDVCNGMQWIKSDMLRALFSGLIPAKVLVRCSGTGCIPWRCHNCTLMPCGKCYDATRCIACDGNGWHQPREVVIGVWFMQEWFETTYDELLESFARSIAAQAASSATGTTTE